MININELNSHLSKHEGFQPFILASDKRACVAEVYGVSITLTFTEFAAIYGKSRGDTEIRNQLVALCEAKIAEVYMVLDAWIKAFGLSVE